MLFNVLYISSSCMPKRNGISTRMVGFNFFNCLNRTQLQHFSYKVEGSKTKLRKKSLQRNNKRKLQFLISPNNLNSLLFVFLMVTQTLVDTVFSKGKNS